MFYSCHHINIPTPTQEETVFIGENFAFKIQRIEFPYISMTHVERKCVQKHSPLFILSKKSESSLCKAMKIMQVAIIQCTGFNYFM